ncbi:30S ribosomal protein S21 [Bacteriovoracaceae bacterium]|nr:30S ribosomal protein S21 [Bacteriovoracaceae bacterium]
MQNIKLKVDERFGVEKTIRKFKRLCDNYGIVREYRNRSEYKKPSVKTKEKTEAAEKRRRKSEFKMRRSSKKI